MLYFIVLDEILSNLNSKEKGNFLEYYLMKVIYDNAKPQGRYKLYDIVRSVKFYIDKYQFCETDVTVLYKKRLPFVFNNIYKVFQSIFNIHAIVGVNYQCANYEGHVPLEKLIHDAQQFNTLKTIGYNLPFITLVLSNKKFKINFKRRYHIKGVKPADYFYKNYKIIGNLGSIKTIYERVLNLDEITLDDIISHVSGHKKLDIKKEKIIMGDLYFVRKGFKKEFINIIESSDEKYVRHAIRNMWILLNPAYFVYISRGGVTQGGQEFLSKFNVCYEGVNDVLLYLKRGLFFKTHDEFSLPKSPRAEHKEFVGKTEARFRKLLPYVPDKPFWKAYDKFMTEKRRISRF